MAENSITSFERCCRLCAEEQEVTIMLFSPEAQAMLLQKKLHKYLLIEVEEDDKLPKNVCIKCCSKLQSVCHFIDTARNAQLELQKRSVMSGTCTLEEPQIKIEVQSEPEDNINNEDKNISQTAQTDLQINNIMFNKFAFEEDLEPQKEQDIFEPEGNLDDDNKCTAMEISVDPMDVLQNHEETMSPVIQTAFTTEDVTHMHSVDQDVTIKRIRKNDKCDTQSIDFLHDQSLKPFPCSVCNRGFFTELALKNHSWIHLDEDKFEKVFKCSTCNEGFDFRCDLVMHLKTHKINGLCQLCGRCFRTESNLETHMATHLTRSKLYICKTCGRSYNTKSNLKTHSITHSNERPYECHLCKKTFKRNQDLKFHINQHTGAKPYKCPFCDKCFASSGNCYSHRNRMHPGRHFESKTRRRAAVSRENLPLRPIAPKPPLATVKGMFKYQCSVCDHSFVKRDNFIYHMFQHTGEKPFHCTFCPDKFVTRRGLLIHHGKEHPTKDRPLALLTKNVLLK